jgi:hypothetical protein
MSRYMQTLKYFKAYNNLKIEENEAIIAFDNYILRNSEFCWLKVFYIFESNLKKYWDWQIVFFGCEWIKSNTNRTPKEHFRSETTLLLKWLAIILKIWSKII